MNCLVSFGSTELPESNLKNCHGILKEEIQEIMIERLHSQISSNIDQIAGEF